MDLKTYFKTNSQAEFARQIGVTTGAVSQWANGLSPVAAERCPQIERATNGLVRCEDLRPDVAWSVLRGTPVNQPDTQPTAQGV
jgi:DNA-binding transcriptional regulator YdaS (Cro superfamily)